MNRQLAFIGAGNMACSLIGGLLARGVRADQIIAADPIDSQLHAVEAEYGVRTTGENSIAISEADVVILAVKPQELRRVVLELASTLQRRRPLIISVAAGIRASDLQKWAGGLAVVRCMPNRPALHGCGVTGLFATLDTPAEGKAIAEEMLSAVGKTLWLPRESDMDTVTAISGSGPAYFFLLVEMLEEAGRSLGLSAEVSRTLAAETAYGAGAMVRQAPSAALLREQVTSKGGTTEAALRHLEVHRIRQAFSEAVAAAARRSAQLADEFGG